MQHQVAHTPVLRDEVVQLLSPADRHILVDCTLGLGGHAEALLDAAGPQARLIGIDADEGNLRDAKARLETFGPRVRFFHANFSDLADVLAAAGVVRVDALLADLGTCSVQLDDPRRGFSFAADGPLDMRMNTATGATAAKLVNTLEEERLAELIYSYGQERYSRRIARAICLARRHKPIESTVELANVVVAAYPRPALRARRGVHPATRTFQALRIAVNDELASLERLLDALPNVLAKGGRAAVVSFHSLEDRRVKQAFAAWTKAGAARLLTRKPVTPGEAEIERNPRSRSAKLRGLEKLD